MSEVLESLPSVNGVILCDPAEALDAATVRQRACTELLRQAALSEGLLSPGDAGWRAGCISAQASAAIEAYLAHAIDLTEPDAQSCRRYYDAHPAQFETGEQAQVRHILYAVTPGVDVDLLRQRAEATLLALRCADPDGPDFAQRAQAESNCPSGAHGGDLGWITRDDVVPEFAQAVFGQSEVGVLARLVRSRYGFHVVQVRARQAGQRLPFAAVQGAVAQRLQQHRHIVAVRRLLGELAARARLHGVPFEAAQALDAPLTQ
ncbi:MAG: peptidylprolyl isomerase [Rhodoferax sp.]